MPINSRSKGAKNERNIAKILQTWTGKKFSKTPASGGLQWQSANSKGDVVCTTEGHFFPFCIEAKSYNKIDFSHLLTPNIKNVDILDFWKQCSRDAKKCNKVPMLLMRYNRLPKGFFFLVVTQEFYREISKRVGRVEKSLLYLHETETEIIHCLRIMPSMDFFDLDYKEVKVIAKQYIKDHYGNGRKK
jgi:Holliday junction resolvase